MNMKQNPLSAPVRRFRPAAALLVAAVLAMAACADDAPTGPLPDDDGRVRVDPVLSGACAATAPAATRAADDDTPLPEISERLLKPLPDGSTLWVVVYSEPAVDNGTEGLGEEYKDQIYDYNLFTNPRPYAYKVVNFTDEYGKVHSGLSPIAVAKDENGRFTADAGKEGTPMYLKKGYWYMFRVASPAYPLVGEEGMWIDNGQYLLANVDTYQPNDEGLTTRPLRAYIPDTQPAEGGGAEIVTLKMNPVINQTAQIQVTLQGGKNVNRLNAAYCSLTVSGLQEPIPRKEKEGAAGSLPVNWSFTKPEFERYAGFKNSLLELTNKDVERIDQTTITTRTAVLPADNFASPIILTFTVLMNFTLVQQQCILSGQRFYPGFSYHYLITLDVVDGVVVANWTVSSWNHDLVLKQQP